jgi:hypothetical protein
MSRVIPAFMTPLITILFAIFHLINVQFCLDIIVYVNATAIKRLSQGVFSFSAYSIGFVDGCTDCRQPAR